MKPSVWICALETAVVSPATGVARTPVRFAPDLTRSSPGARTSAEVHQGHIGVIKAPSHGLLNKFKHTIEGRFTQHDAGRLVDRQGPRWHARHDVANIAELVGA